MSKNFIQIRNDAGGKGPSWLTIRNDASSSAAEVLIHGQIGKDWWSDDGVSEKEFLDALSNIPKDREITVGVNSEGGEIKCGLGIYNALQARRERVTVRIDGYACSIASIIALAGKRTISPKSSIWMIHEPWTYAAGNAEDFQRASDMLEQHAEMLVDIYAQHTGKTRDEIRAAMKKETWLRGDEAVSFGLADECSEDHGAMSLKNSFDFTKLKNAPDYVKNLAVRNAATAKTENNNPKESYMDRNEIIAALKARGDVVDETKTTEQLKAQLLAPPQAKAAATPATPAQTQSTPAPAASADPSVAALAAEMKLLREQRDAEKRARISQKVKDLQPNRFPVDQVDAWVEDAMRDEKVLDRLAALPEQAPGAPAANIIELTSEAISDVSKFIVRNSHELGQAFIRNVADPAAVSRGAVAAAIAYAKNRDRILAVFNTNNVPTELKRQVILNESLRAFKRKMIPLNAFATVYSNVPLLGTAKINVPYFPLYTSASKDYVTADGYVFDKDTTTQAKEIEVNKRKYQPFTFTSEELARQPYFNPTQLAMLMGEQLGVDVLADILSVVTLATYGAAVKSEPAAAFDVNDVMDIANVCDEADWPEVGRGLILDSDYVWNLAKSDDIKGFDKSGSDAALRRGVIGQIAGFDIFKTVRLPANAENLVGIATHQSGILFAGSPIAPAPGVRSQLIRYALAIDPETGLTLEYRYGADTWKDADREVIECNYGYAAGETAAIKRITSA